jgi:hypothetical protein
VVGDPLGSTSLVAAEDGTPLSRSRYTPFGDGRHVRVAETQVWNGSAWEPYAPDPTEPIPETDHLYQGDYLERELGIYFTADARRGASARYYDPWLGKWRFLAALEVARQPDPIGGPPLIPQAADRYQYAGNSPTGVGPGSSSAYWAFVGDVALELGQEGIAKLLSRALPRRVVRETIATGVGRLYISARRVSQLDQAGIYRYFELDWDRTWRMGEPAFVSRGLVKRFGDGYIDSASGRYFSLRGSGAYEDLFNEKYVVREAVEDTIGGWIASEIGIPFALDAGFQLLQDLGNPYLTAEQKAWRAGWAGGVGAVSNLTGWGAGLLAGKAVMGLGLAAGPAGWVVIGVGVVVGIGVELAIHHWITPMVYESAGWNEETRLLPLEGGLP